MIKMKIISKLLSINIRSKCWERMMNTNSESSNKHVQLLLLRCNMHTCVKNNQNIFYIFILVMLKCCGDKC